MSRIRTIKPEFYGHPVMGRCTDEARLAAIGTLNFSDDEGYFRADPALFRAEVFPFDEDSTKTRRVLVELSRAGWCEIRTHPLQGDVGRVVNFLKHQRLDRPSPSKLKAYFDESPSPRRVLDESSTPEQGTGKGREQGKEEEASPAQPALPGMDSVELPFQSESFKIAWGDYCQHRKELRRKLTPQATRGALNDLREMGEARAIAALRYTISRGWQGIREPDTKGSRRPAEPAKSGDAQSRRGLF